MQISKRILAACLAFLMLVSLVACVVPDEPDPQPTETHQKAPTTDEPTETTENKHPQNNLPAKNYGGQDFRILGRGNQQPQTWGRVRDIVYDSELVPTNSINEAVRDRNAYVEDTFGVSIKGIFDSDLGRKVEDAKDSGFDLYDIVEDSFSVYATLIEDGYLLNLNTVSPYLDLSQSYWNQTCRKEMSIAGALYFCPGDIMTSDKEGCWSITFNRDIVKNDNALEDPYTLVDTKVWTIDKMYEMASHVCNKSSYDPDDYFNITWGCVSGSGNTYFLWQGSGTRLIVKDAVTDLPELAPLTEGAYDAMILAAKLNFDKEVVLFAEDIRGVADTNFDGIIKIFQTGHSLFNIGSMTMVEWMREHDTDFGVLPLPKASVEQENYYSTMSSTYAYSVAIPISNENLEFTAIITQALACESTPTVLEAYYDKTLVHKGLRRVEDVRMLDLIFANRLYDLSEVFSWASPLMSQIGAAKNESKVKSIKSKYDSYAKNINKSISDFLTKQGLI